MRFHSMYGVFPRGYGKCVTGDSLLFTEDGIKEIGEYFNYSEPDNDEYIPLDIKLVNRNGDLEQSIMGVSSGLRDTKRVITEEGYELEGTKVHPVLVISEEGNIEWEQLQNINPGDYVLINRKNNVWGKETKLSFDMESYMDQYNNDPTDKIIPKHILESSKETMVNFISGLCNANSVFGPDYYQIIVGSEKMSKQLQTVLLNFGVVSNRTKENNKYILTMYGYYAYRFFMEMGFEYNYTEEQLDLISKHNNDYFYSKVKTVEDDEKYVYDLSLLDTHSFISNGFVSHNTFNEVIVMFLTCVLYPGMEMSLTAQTKENAAELLKDKHNDIVKKYPWFKNEIFDYKFSKNDAEITFMNESRIDILANHNSSKGQRRNVLKIEEAALIDNVVLEDALIPIVEHGRMTVGALAMNNPEELDQKVSYFTTSGFRGSDEFERSLKMVDDMSALKGNLVLGSDWHLGCWYGRGSTKQQILKKKRDMSPIAFAQNYESKWSGASKDAIADINKLLKLRVLGSPILSNDGKHEDEIYLSMDVARSESAANNKSSIAILRVIRNKEERIKNIQLVNLVNLKTGSTYSDQVLALKRLVEIYKPKKVIYDHNGLGKGIGDELVRSHKDPVNGETYPAIKIENVDIYVEDKEAKNIGYGVTSQGINTDIITNFMNMVESEILEILVKKTNTAHLNLSEHEMMPYVETDMLIEEIANIKIKHLSGGKMTEQRISRRVDKDRYSALVYGLYYIKEFCDKRKKKEDVDISKLFTFHKPKTRRR